MLLGLTRDNLSCLVAVVFGAYLVFVDNSGQIAGAIHGLGHGFGFGHGLGYAGRGLGYHFINYTAVFEIKCIKKGGTCEFVDDCDIETHIYFKACGYNKSVVCCVPREIACKLKYGICSEDREGCTSAGFFWSWFQCNDTHRCCRPHKFKKKKKKKIKVKKFKKKDFKHKKPRRRGYGSSSSSSSSSGGHGHSSSSSSGGHGHSSSSHGSSSGFGGYGGFLHFVKKR